MSFDFNAYVRQHRAGMDLGDPRNNYHVLPRIVCKDGFSMSVQASFSAYCEPRSLLPTGGDYYTVEAGFPSAPVPELMEYADDTYNPTKTVYGYVPVHIVEAIIDAHGGAA